MYVFLSAETATAEKMKEKRKCKKKKLYKHPIFSVIFYSQMCGTTTCCVSADIIATLRDMPSEKKNSQPASSPLHLFEFT